MRLQMNKLRWRFLLIISMLIIFNTGCTEKPEHSNPFDPLSDGYSGIGSITGLVVESAGPNLPAFRPIPGAEVVATQNGERKGSAVALADSSDPNSLGSFIISNLLAGNYDLNVSAAGYKSVIIKGVTVSDEQATGYWINLLRE